MVFIIGGAAVTMLCLIGGIRLARVKTGNPRQGFVSGDAKVAGMFILVTMAIVGIASFALGVSTALAGTL